MNIKSILISIALAVVLTFMVATFAHIIVLLLIIPGTWLIAKMQREKVNMVSEAISGSKSVPYETKLSGKTQDNRVDMLKDQMANHLEEKWGLSPKLASAAVHFRARLMWDEAQWDKFIRRIETLKGQGFDEGLLMVHLRLVVVSPTAHKLDLLREMTVEHGVRDLDALGCALNDRSYTVDSFEKAIYEHDVVGLDWSKAVSKSLVPS